jgi:hypothetical protein
LIGPFFESTKVIVEPDKVAVILSPDAFIAETIPDRSSPGKSTDISAELVLSDNVKVKFPGFVIDLQSSFSYC